MRRTDTRLYIAGKGNTRLCIRQEQAAGRNQKNQVSFHVNGVYFSAKIVFFPHKTTPQLSQNRKPGVKQSVQSV